MAVVQFETVRRVPFAGGAAFESAGPYERIDALAHYAVDPAATENCGIVDLASAERGRDGLVHFDGDVTILRPLDPARGQRAALVEMPNRGHPTAPWLFNRAFQDVDSSDAIPPGDGFLFRQGWTVAWCGWQWDVPRSGPRIGLRAPRIVGSDGTPLVGTVQLRLQLSRRITCVELTDQHVGDIGGHEPIPTVDVNDPRARLLVRDGLWGAHVEIPRNRWRFARDVGEGQATPDPSHLWLDGGFEPGRIYDLIYTTASCPVAGTGLLAVRDFGAFLRSANPANPCAGELDHLIATGTSQCGRFLRTYLHLGLNRTQDGAQAYDGILAHVAGGRRGEFNHRGAQPSVQPTPSFGHRFPFADEGQSDPRSDKTDGLLETQRGLGALPKVMYTNTASEYWRGDGSLAHTSVVDGTDIDPPATTRHYLFASTQHGPGTLPFADASAFGTRGGNPFNIVDYTPLMRAALTNLLSWVVSNVEPPPSAVPRSDGETAVTRNMVLKALNGIPSLACPEERGLWTLRPLDLGPGEQRGIGVYPAVPVGDAYPCFVSAVDSDGNEVAGIRLPEVAVPLATHAGWNPRHRDTGAPEQILDYMGSTVRFARDAAEREALNDPRPSIAERYADEEDYRARVQAAAEAMVQARYLLAEDVATCEQIALERYGALTS